MEDKLDDIKKMIWQSRPGTGPSGLIRGEIEEKSMSNVCERGPQERVSSIKTRICFTAALVRKPVT